MTDNQLKEIRLLIYFQILVFSNPGKYSFKTLQDAEKAYIEFLKEIIPDTAKEYKPIAVLG